MTQVRHPQPGDPGHEIREEGSGSAGRLAPPSRWTSSRGPLVLAITVSAVLFLGLRVGTLPTLGARTAEINEFGLLAVDLNNGLEEPLEGHITHPRELCSIPWGFFVAPVFRLLGPSMYSLRLSSVLWNTLALCVFALLAGRVAGWRGASLFGALWVLAPPGLVELQWFGLPNHLEACLISGLGLLCLSRAATLGRARSSLFWVTLAGLFAGLAVSFHYTSAPMPLAMAATVALCPWRYRAPLFAFLALGLFCGMCPVFATRLVDMGAGSADILGAAMAGPGEPKSESGYWLARAVKLALVEPLALPGFDVSHGGYGAGLAYVCGLALLCLPGLRRFLQVLARPAGSRPLRSRGSDTAGEVVAVCCILFLVGFVLAVLLLGLPYEHWDLAPVWPYGFLLATTSLGSSRLRAWGKEQLGPAAVLFALAFPLIPPCWALLHPPQREPFPCIDCMFKGYRPSQQVRERLESTSPAVLLERVVLGDTDRFEWCEHLGVGVALAHAEEGQERAFWAAVQRHGDRLPRLSRPAYWQGVGSTLVELERARDRAPGEQGSPTGRLVETIDSHVERRASRLALAFGMGREFWSEATHPNDPVVWNRITVELEEDTVWAMCAGSGAIGMYERHWYHHPPGRTAPTIPPVPLMLRKGCTIETMALGMGIELARETLPEEEWADPGLLLDRWYDGPSPQVARDQLAAGYRAERVYVHALQGTTWTRWDGASGSSVEELCPY